MKQRSTWMKVASLMLFSGMAFTAMSQEPMEMKTYSVSQENPVNLVFTAPELGVLTTAQTGTTDPHLYTTAEGGPMNYVQDPRDLGKGSYAYTLGKGETVYYIAPENSYDGVTSVTFSWEASEVTIPTIENGVAFTSYQEKRVYTPEETGLLTITTTISPNHNWFGPTGAAAGLLFYDYSCTQNVQLQCADTNAKVGVYTTPVVAGTDYYFYNGVSPMCEFTFTLGEMPAPALVSVTPDPGKAFDALGDYGSGVILSFSPEAVTFETASVTYTPVDGEEQTIILTNENGIGENSDFEMTGDYNWKFRAVSRYYALAAKGTNVTLNLTGVNYEGLLVEENETGFSAVEVDNGNVSVYWTIPANEMSITEQSVPTMIYSNSTAGDPKMMAVFTFDQNIDSKPSAMFSFGTQYFGAPSNGDNPDPGADLPCYVSGNVLTVDMSGFDFGKYYDMGSKSYSNLTVFVGNIYGIDGQKFNQENPGIAFRPNYSQEVAPAPAVMADKGTIVYENDPMYPTVFVYWNQQVKSIIAGQPFTGVLTTPTMEEVEVSLVLSTYAPDADVEPSSAADGAAGVVDNALILPMSQYISKYGPGKYTLSVASILMNADLEINAPISDSFEVVADGGESEVEATLAYDGKETITISWDGEALSVYNPYNADILITSESGSEFHAVLGKEVTLKETSVEVDLSALGLVNGEDYTIDVPSYMFYIGGDGEYNGQVLESFKYTGEGAGISSIQTEAAVNGVYNLNGVKVSNGLEGLGKGVYIVNGKKVIIRK